MPRTKLTRPYSGLVGKGHRVQKQIKKQNKLSSTVCHHSRVAQFAIIPEQPSFTPRVVGTHEGFFSVGVVSYLEVQEQHNLRSWSSRACAIPFLELASSTSRYGLWTRLGNCFESIVDICSTVTLLIFIDSKCFRERRQGLLALLRTEEKWKMIKEGKEKEE